MTRLLSTLFVVVASLGGQSSRVGDIAFPNSGSAAAQAPFLYGLAQLHNFEYADAAGAFREAQRLDPTFAMAYWGEAMTKNHPVWMEQDLAGARRVLDRPAPTAGGRLAKAGTERERAYLHSVETLFGSGDKYKRDRWYLDEMRQLHNAYPEDVDASAFYALALLGSAHDGRDEAVYMAAAATLEEAFIANSNHPGVVHYLIHSYDDPIHAPLGLRAARKYSAIAPAAPHALHMTSHIYLAAGMWDDVVAANERATEVAAERARRAGRLPAACGHANLWLLYGYLQQGRSTAARRVLDSCRVVATSAGGLEIGSPDQDPLDPDNIPAASYVQMWARYVIDTGEFVGPAMQDEIALGTLAGARVTRAFVHALAASRADDSKRLHESIEGFRKAHGALLSVLASRGSAADEYRRRADVLDQEVHALLLLDEHRTPDAVDWLRRAAAAEEAMPVAFGPPFVDKPAFELLGDVLLQANLAADAVRAYEAALRRTPKRAGALLGLARAAAAMGSPRAADAYTQLRQIWRDAEQVPADVKAR